MRSKANATGQAPWCRRSATLPKPIVVILALLPTIDSSVLHVTPLPAHLPATLSLCPRESLPLWLPRWNLSVYSPRSRPTQCSTHIPFFSQFNSSPPLGCFELHLPLSPPRFTSPKPALICTMLNWQAQHSSFTIHGPSTQLRPSRAWPFRHPAEAKDTHRSSSPETHTRPRAGRTMLERTSNSIVFPGRSLPTGYIATLVIAIRH